MLAVVVHERNGGGGGGHEQRTGVPAVVDRGEERRAGRARRGVEGFTGGEHRFGTARGWRGGLREPAAGIARYERLVFGAVFVGPAAEQHDPAGGGDAGRAVERQRGAVFVLDRDDLPGGGLRVVAQQHGGLADLLACNLGGHGADDAGCPDGPGRFLRGGADHVHRAGGETELRLEAESPGELARKGPGDAARTARTARSTGVGAGGRAAASPDCGGFLPREARRRRTDLSRGRKIDPARAVGQRGAGGRARHARLGQFRQAAHQLVRQRRCEPQGRTALPDRGERRQQRRRDTGQQARAEHHRFDVEARVVVGEDGAGEALRGVGGAQVARGGEDRIGWVVGVAHALAGGVDAVLGPGLREELHPALGAGAGDREVLSVVGLDFVDGGEHLPGNAVARGRGLVDRQQDGRHAVGFDEEAGHLPRREGGAAEGVALPADARRCERFGWQPHGGADRRGAGSFAGDGHAGPDGCTTAARDSPPALGPAMPAAALGGRLGWNGDGGLRALSGDGRPRFSPHRAARSRRA